MNGIRLNEHDANQGAQSSGEFLGMTGNSGWYLLGSGGATILMVILLWGIFGISLLLCLFVGLVLCLGSVAYVFTLKNNRPEHYDTDFFEASLVESGISQLRFAPRIRPPANPFTGGSDSTADVARPRDGLNSGPKSASNLRGRKTVPAPASDGSSRPDVPNAGAKSKPAVPTVTRAEYDQLQEKLSFTEEMLEDAIAEATEE